MAAMRSVVKYMLDRMDADFHQNDLLMAFSAMDLEYWLPEVIRSQESVPTDVRSAKIISLCKRARCLCMALG
eukprot:11775429-Heterocapsa_arctica.AAC.1